MPTVLIEDLEANCTVTVIVTELFESAPEPNPPAEKPEDEEEKNVWLVGKKDAG
ncbi:MAG: hypothetical protein ACPH10_06300 [Litorivicinaceae bacterium]